ncbi:leucyl/phenylalanyl-tRNA--protein transferase [Pelodictyon luteolum]|uniref:Leucyl/phenylalanyl-tRNA--protein transferase n=1 Tax=Chlorobium luteolum (strain DSM 273 / BCRC 81028 / 2530) TaxID=319225 RepID=LFTR_CHLL3|nr:leucyl/phenylalanyl-tRNA--protein transferase [Pelodictyon luteolum]Q3B5N7.1 RecName: Full=Leucyl/phenylalanyl-tRNA--protein transferase; AltName: Full=L/F-transferase; AltName: Full=Leucyltransferase; AltName: Full=Phenyalanyltransferase [Pelodictyon luteolum DSM 273]ABB23344.1 Leucyl/phenylalanyl-tRNA--protein transferase [Pelodictyon luteolum DSM 273]
MIPVDALLKAYREGFFPMADASDGQLYWCRPEMRALFPLESYRPSRDVLRLQRRGEYSVFFDSDFEAVIRACAAPRKDDPETWISGEIVETYIRIHELGLAHSVECRYRGELAGGLYGIAIGGAFFGESMFYRRSYASQVALWHLVCHLRLKGYLMLDAQIMNPHLRRLGAVEVPHDEYMRLLEAALRKKTAFL